ncbi:MAG: hypothetical protein BGO07_00160 [Alphaproteobacteria bacterium 40-19]|nr:MAG: hypothetical protein BGO07_00160 [Alphaproteobacteria bacterium 40-19]
MNKKRQMILLGFILTSEISFAFDFGGLINSIVSPVTNTIGDIAGGAIRGAAGIVSKVVPDCTPCGNGDAAVRCLQVIESPGQDTVIKTGAQYSGRVRRCLKAAIPPVCGPSQDDLEKARQFCQSHGQILDVDAANKYEKSVIDNALKLGTATINQVATSASAIGAAGIGAYKGDANVVKAAVEVSGDEKRKNDFHKLDLKEAKKQLKNVSDKNAGQEHLPEYKNLELKGSSEHAQKESENIVKEDKPDSHKEKKAKEISKEAQEISRLKLELEATKKKLENISKKNAEYLREHKNLDAESKDSSENASKYPKNVHSQSEVVHKGPESKDQGIKEFDHKQKHEFDVHAKNGSAYGFKEKEVEKDSKLPLLHQKDSAIKDKKGASQEFHSKELKDLEESDDESFEKLSDQASGHGKEQGKHKKWKHNR